MIDGHVGSGQANDGSGLMNPLFAALEAIWKLLSDAKLSATPSSKIAALHLVSGETFDFSIDAEVCLIINGTPTLPVTSPC